MSRTASPAAVALVMADTAAHLARAGYAVTARDLRDAPRRNHTGDQALREGRHLIAHVLNVHHGISLKQVGRYLNRDHTTVLYSVRRVDNDPRLTELSSRIAYARQENVA